MSAPPKRPPTSTTTQPDQFEKWIDQGVAAQRIIDRLLAELDRQGVTATGSVGLTIALPVVRAEGTEIGKFAPAGPKLLRPKHMHGRKDSDVAAADWDPNLPPPQRYEGSAPGTFIRLTLAKYAALQRRARLGSPTTIPKLDAAADGYVEPTHIDGLPIDLAIMVSENEQAIRTFLGQREPAPPPPRRLPALTGRNAARYITAVAAAVAAGDLPPQIAGPLLYAAQLQIAAARLYPERERPSRAKGESSIGLQTIER